MAEGIEFGNFDDLTDEILGPEDEILEPEDEILEPEDDEFIDIPPPTLRRYITKRRRWEALSGILLSLRAESF